MSSKPNSSYFLHANHPANWYSCKISNIPIIVKSCEYNTHCQDGMQCGYITVCASVQCYAACWSHTEQSTRHDTTQAWCHNIASSTDAKQGKNSLHSTKELHACIPPIPVIQIQSMDRQPYLYTILWYFIDHHHMWLHCHCTTCLH